MAMPNCTDLHSCSVGSREYAAGTWLSPSFPNWKSISGTFKNYTGENSSYRLSPFLSRKDKFVVYIIFISCEFLSSSLGRDSILIDSSRIPLIASTTTTKIRRRTTTFGSLPLLVGFWWQVWWLDSFYFFTFKGFFLNIIWCVDCHSRCSAPATYQTFFFFPSSSYYYSYFLFFPLLFSFLVFASCFSCMTSLRRVNFPERKNSSKEKGRREKNGKNERNKMKV